MRHFTPFLSLLLLCCGLPALAQPANDECSTALLLTVTPACSGVEQDAAEATQSMDPIPCGGWNASQANDMWYHFAGTGGNVTIQVTGLGDIDVVVELFSGACGALVSTSCADATYTDGEPEEIIVATTEGTDYTFRVYPYLTSFADFLFTVCAFEGGSTAGVDEVSAASPLRIRPNPSQGNLVLSTGEAQGRTQVDITDVSGRLVYSAQHVSGANGDIELQLEGVLAGGTYALRTRSAAGILSTTFVVD